jgi:hypothetical protein
MDNLSFDILNLIFKKLDKTDDFLSIRLVCKTFNSYFKDIIPFYFNQQYIGNIILKNNIIWYDFNKKKFKEIIFKKYAVVEVKVYNYKYFKKTVSYNLPKTITKNEFQNYSYKNTKIDLDNDKIDIRNQSLFNSSNGIPSCIIS